MFASVDRTTRIRIGYVPAPHASPREQVFSSMSAAEIDGTGRPTHQERRRGMSNNARKKAVKQPLHGVKLQDEEIREIVECKEIDVDRKEMEQQIPSQGDPAMREVSHNIANGIVGSPPLADSEGGSRAHCHRSMELGDEELEIGECEGLQFGFLIERRKGVCTVSGGVYVSCVDEHGVLGRSRCFRGG